ncbi:iron-sulfur cluster assembly scaffold protein [Desulfosoma caldarium]|uniref:hypothetical protein n=1 Tax=Desulfosoma caldarium TaxID=610254 RepID=UPI0011CE7992|nr:hypothetical protein [Desulfosoma caldarium]
MKFVKNCRADATKDVAEAPVGLPMKKRHCSNLGAESPALAIKNYEEGHADSEADIARPAASRPNDGFRCDTETPSPVSVCMECDNDSGCEWPAVGSQQTP